MSEVRLSSLLGPSFRDFAHDVLIHGHTHYDLSGGRGSLKSSTVSLLVPLILIQNPTFHALVLRKVGNTLRDSVFSQYMWGIGELGMSEFWKARVSPMELIYQPTGQKIMFRGADDPMKIKSIKVPFGYIAVTHFEEKDQFAGRKEIRTILQSTMRGGSTYWNFESYNPPISRDNWANLDSLEVREDRLCHHSTYLEAPQEWLGEQFLAEAELLKEQNERAYRHEYLGEATGTGSEVFENLDIREITDGEILTFDSIYQGLDFGFFPAPANWVKLCYNPNQRKIYIFDELRAYKAGNAELWRRLKEEKGVRETDLITADSAEPKSIADFRMYGSMMRGAIKGPDSRDYSFKWLQSLSGIVIDPARCPNAAKEFSTYEYQRTPDDEIISGYPDGNDHSIDSVRYALNNVWRRKGQ